MLPLSSRVASRHFDAARRIEDITPSAFSLMLMSDGPAWCRAALEAGGSVDIAGAFIASDTLGVLARVNHPNGAARDVIWSPGDVPADDRTVEIVDLVIGRGSMYLGDDNGPAGVVNGSVAGRRRWFGGSPTRVVAPPTGSSSLPASQAVRV